MKKTRFRVFEPLQPPALRGLCIVAAFKLLLDLSVGFPQPEFEVIDLPSFVFDPLLFISDLLGGFVLFSLVFRSAFRASVQPIPAREWSSRPLRATVSAHPVEMVFAAASNESDG